MRLSLVRVVAKAWRLISTDEAITTASSWSLLCLHPLKNSSPPRLQGWENQSPIASTYNSGPLASPTEDLKFGSEEYRQLCTIAAQLKRSDHACSNSLGSSVRGVS